jgi:penicillin-insensitive murein endopeptidase
MRATLLVALLLPLLPALAGCVGPALLTDGSSVSMGDHRSGLLRHGTPLPFRGRGFIVPERWRLRHRNYGTEELVHALMRAAYYVERRYRGATVGFADLSPAGGGSTTEHGSHTSGRDADVIFYATDLNGHPLVPREMVAYDATGLALPATLGPETQPATPPRGPGLASGPPLPDAAAAAPVVGGASQRFDVRRNWALMRALLTDPRIEVQWLFINRDLARLLLDQARRAGEPERLLERAAALMHQPGDAGLHNDHFHLRIFCPPGDRELGCRDLGPPRWRDPAVESAAGAATPAAPLPLLLEELALLARRFPLL